MINANQSDPDQDQTINLLLDKVLPMAADKGWNDAVFHIAVEEAGIDFSDAIKACPRQCLDLAIAYFRRGDDLMAEKLQGSDISQLRYSYRVAKAIRLRLSVMAEHRVATRKAVALFSQCRSAGVGACVIWRTTDSIWEGLGDSSEDINWYTKRLILSTVYSASLLYWLGDSSSESENTWDFIDRRIDDVMRVEGVKKRVRENLMGRQLMRVLDQVGRRIHKPSTSRSN